VHTTNDARSRAGKSGGHNDNLQSFRVAFDLATAGIGLVDLDGKFSRANNALAGLLGFSAEEMEGKFLWEMFVPEEREQAQAEFKHTACTGKALTVLERRYLNKQGAILFAETTASLVRSEAGKPLHFVVSIKDITENRRLQAILDEQATTDPLTGAANRKQIEKNVRSEMLRSDRYGVKLSLAMIDLDHFEEVNSTYGREVGDLVLRGFCDIARNCHRASDAFGHWEGDRYVALLPETGLTGAHFFADRLRSALENFRFNGDKQITACIGVVGYREGEDALSLIARATACVSLAKQRGRNRVVDDAEDIQREIAGMLSFPQLVNLHWRVSYHSGEELVDLEHKELFGLANRVITAVTEEGSGDEVLPLVRDLIEHVGTHFSHEEELLHAANYPAADKHGRIHGRLLERARTLLDMFESGQGSAADLLGFVIHDVVARHILGEDRKFFPWLKKAKQG
jgi:diguanylate cyclase (GGDEF)-like protein/hemerythrin-like metal-binding protein/PAS domain S-box-containing protein